MVVARVSVTDAAVKLIGELKAGFGPLMFHQSGGCCDGSAPMCYPQGELLIGDQDVLLGEIDGCPFYISRPQFEYWQHTHLIIDAVPGHEGALYGHQGLAWAEIGTVTLDLFGMGVIAGQIC